MKNTFFKRIIPLTCVVAFLFYLCFASCCSVSTHTAFSLDSASVKHLNYEKHDTISSSYKK